MGPAGDADRLAGPGRDGLEGGPRAQLLLEADVVQRHGLVAAEVGAGEDGALLRTAHAAYAAVRSRPRAPATPRTTVSGR